MENSENKPLKKKNHYTRFNHDNHSEYKPIGYPTKLILNSIIILLIVKLYFLFISGNIQLIFPYIISFIQDSTILILNYYLFSLIFLTGVFRGAVKYIFYTIHFIIFFTCITYSKFLSDMLAYPINIFTIKFELIFFFFKNFVNLENFIIIILVIGFTLLVSNFFPTHESTQKKVKYLFILILILFLPTLLKPALNPIIYSSVEQSKNFIQISNYNGKINHINLEKNNTTNNNFTFIDKRMTIDELKNIDLSDSKYSNVLIFVTESQNYENINNESEYSLTFEKSRFNCEKYTNYYSTNLDSYTSLISILNSILVPYPAYASNDYSFINNKTNLVKLFSKNDYKTIFISTYNENPYIPNKLDWNQSFERENFNETDYLCLDISKIDSACEDKIAINTIINELKINNKTFLMHEMVYGHLSKWEEKTKTKPLDYYNTFFNELLTKLNENNLSNQTLIIVLSDHGKRSDATNLANYHIPLYMCALDFEKKENRQFLSHINFKDILLEKITKDNKEKIEYNVDNNLFVIGSSNVWVYGLIQYNITNMSYAFINNKNLKVKTNINETDVINFSRDFNDYILYFNNQNK